MQWRARSSILWAMVAMVEPNYLTIGNSIHSRVEQMAPDRYDVVTSRAFAALPDFVRNTRSLLPENGVWLAMKGKIPHEEIAALPQDVEVFHVEQIIVPGLQAERRLVWMRALH